MRHRRRRSSARVTASTASGSRSNSRRQRVGVGLAAGLLGELLHPHGRRVQQLVDDPAHGRLDLARGCGRRGRARGRRAGRARRRRRPRPSRAARRRSARRWTARCQPRNAATSSATIARAASTSAACSVSASASASVSRSTTETPARSWTAGSTSRGSARSSSTSGRPFAPRCGRGDGVGLDDVADGAGAGDDEVGRGEGRRRDASSATARPPTEAASRCAWSSVRLATTTLRRARLAGHGRGERAHRAGADDEHLGARTAVPSTRAASSRPAVTSERPARSMPVSVWARLPTRSACWTSSDEHPRRSCPRPARGAARA